MRKSIWVIAGTLAAAFVGGIAGGQVPNLNNRTKVGGVERPIVEGPIVSLVYVGANGQFIGAPVDLNAALGVNPNDDAADRYGRLFRDYLVVSNPRQRDAGVRVVPSNRIVQLTFADE